MVMSDYSQNTVPKLINYRVDSRKVYPHLTIRSVKVRGLEGIDNRGPPFNLFYGKLSDHLGVHVQRRRLRGNLSCKAKSNSPLNNGSDSTMRFSRTYGPLKSLTRSQVITRDFLLTPLSRP